MDEYYKEMEVAMTRANVEEDREATMARFLSGLNPDIANIAKLHHYVEMEDMVHTAIKVERQLKKRSFRSQPLRSSPITQKPNLTNPWKSNEKKDEIATSKPTFEPYKAKEMGASKDKGKINTPILNRDLKCFRCLSNGHIASQCPNKKTMNTLASGEVGIDNETEEDEMPSIEELVKRR